MTGLPGGKEGKKKRGISYTIVKINETMISIFIKHSLVLLRKAFLLFIFLFLSCNYLSSDLEFGSFFKASNADQGVISAGVNYFTPLLESEKWKFRQFVKPELIIGINRFPFDTLTLKDGYGLNGFNSFGLSGTNRMVLTLQSQAYAPWDVVGFHFGPYFICSFGMLGDAETRFKNSKVYSQIGIGVLIKNINLVYTSFQISLSFYPSIPGIGQNIFKVNSFGTNDIGFRDFEIGKPAPVIYQ